MDGPRAEGTEDRDGSAGGRGVITLCPRVPNQGIIDLLTEILERAKVGDVVAIAGITLNMEGAFGEFRSNNAFDHAIPFISYIRVLQMRFEREVQMD